MNAIVKATAVCDLHSGSAIDSAASAGLKCLGAAGLDPAEVNVLINVGVYRENNIMEPSIAALIQQKMELNPDPARQDMHRRTLSYDLVSGATGFLNAARLADSLMQTGAAKSVLILSADVHPSGEARPDFPFSTLGAAVLLQASENATQGFGPFAFRTSASGNPGYRSYGALQDFGSEGRRLAIVTQDPGWVDRLETFAVTSGRAFLQQQNIAPDQIDLLVTSQLQAGFPGRLAQQLGLKDDCHAIDRFAIWGDPHTSSPGACLHALQQSGRLTSGKNLLFVSVGSGLSSACALYRV